MVNENKVVLSSAARVATTSSSVCTNYQHRGAHVVVNVTAVPGVDTVTPKIEGYDPNTDTYYDLLVGAAKVDTGTVILKVYPGIPASANLAASDFLPTMWRVTMTHSGVGSFTYSVSVNLEG